ncbi:MAG: hypothetical protein IIY70_06305 [Oscillospiraceae bacterium]|nr:hypothetical protein [Oscillospiraceae bacterium]
MKRKNLLTTLLFCLFLGTMLLLTLLLPHRVFSELENRTLAAAPRFSADALFSGRWMQEAERWISDHTVLRDRWVQLMGLSERISGKQENNGVYFAAGDTLISRLDEPDSKLVEKNLSAVRDFAAHCPVPVRFGLIPTAASVWAERLPAGAETLAESDWIARLYRDFGGQSLDLEAVLNAHRAEPVYYRTDHHWTSLGARYAADGIFRLLDLPLLEETELEQKTVSTTFLGSSSSKACAWWVAPDEITTMVPETGIQVESSFSGKPEPGSLYVPSWLEKKNQYAYFLGGNQPLCVLRTKHAGPKLLLVRDSYTDSLAPFLCLRCSELHLIDLRYYRDSVQSYVAEQGIDQVLILYSLSTFLEDPNLPLLRK